MAAITDADILTAVKNGLVITHTFADETLKIFIHEIKGFLISAGVTADDANDDMCIGLYVRGCMDLWNFGSGDGKLSPYFHSRLIQIAINPQEIPNV